MAKSKMKGRAGLRRQQLIFVWVMLAIPIAHFLVFWLYTNLNSILLAFKNIDLANGGKEYWTFDNFKTVFKMFTGGDPNNNMLLFARNTLLFWLVGTVWSIPHSILMTYAFHKKMHGSKFFRIFLYLPSIMNSVALAGIYQAFISGNGVFGYVLTHLFGVDRVPAWFQEQETAIWALLFYNFFFGFAGSYIVFSGAMANVDREITEAAYMDGITMSKEIRYIDIPLMWPTLSMTLITSFASLFSASGPILLLTPNVRSTFTFGYWIFDQVRVYGSYYVPAALGLCFTLIAFPVCMLIKHFVEKAYTTE